MVTLIRRTGNRGPGRGVRAGGVHRGAAAMANIEQNGYGPAAAGHAEDHARRLHRGAFPVSRGDRRR